MFICNVVLSWEPVVESLSGTGEDWDHPYSFLRHTEKLLSYTPEKHFLIDALSNLKRAVDHRIKHISTIYKLKKTTCYVLKKNIWDTLVELEVIKPVMLGKLLEIRNAVEHQFSDPPSQARCIELSEFVWYFLRSTDSISKQISTSFYLRDIKDSLYNPYNICYNGNPENEWASTITAHLPKDLISPVSKADYFEVSEITVQSGNEYKHDALKDNVDAEILKILSINYHDDDFIITGQLQDKNIELWFLRLYFRTGV